MSENSAFKINYYGGSSSKPVDVQFSPRSGRLYVRLNHNPVDISYEMPDDVEEKFGFGTRALLADAAKSQIEAISQKYGADEAKKASSYIMWSFYELTEELEKTVGPLEEDLTEVIDHLSHYVRAKTAEFMADAIKMNDRLREERLKKNEAILSVVLEKGTEALPPTG